MSSPEKVIRTIVAFADGASAPVLIGVTGGKRQLVGVPDPTKVEELKRLVQRRTFDEEPMPELGKEALDFRAAS